MIRSVAADRQAVAREGVKRIAELHEHLDEEAPDVLLLDLSVPGGELVSVLRRIREAHPDVSVAALSANPRPDMVRRCLDLGAVGYLPRGAGVKEFEVLQLGTSGLRPQEIAERLVLSRMTVSTDRRRTLRKLGLSTFPEAIRYAVEHAPLDRSA